MTTQEAIEILTQDDYGNCDCGNWCQAYDMAIRNLEAWEKCRQDIISFISTLKAKHYDYDVALDILEIINKNLIEEVENEDNN